MSAQQSFSVDNGLPDQNVINSLSPSLLWGHFKTLCGIPRGSKEETGIADHIFSLAIEKDYPVVRDKYHNLLVTVPATAGMEHVPFLCIQSHMDMVLVNESGGPQFPIRLQLEDKKLRATNTTLGADNGIGVSAMMAIMTDKTLQHGPLELLFTTQEEIGLVGAEHFDYSRVQSKRFLNLDSEEEGILYVGCAGAGRIEAKFPKEAVAATSGYIGFQMEFSDFLGGHSGLAIHEDRGNAILKLVSLLMLCASKAKIEVASIKGGNAMNAIPTSATAVVMVPEQVIPELHKKISEFIAQTFRVYKKEKPKFSMKRIPVSGSEKVLSGQTLINLFTALTVLPVGVITREDDFPLMPKTSNNLGIIRTTEEFVEVTTMYRSSSQKELDDTEKTILDLFIKTEASVSVDSKYSPWEPQFDTALLALVKEKAEKVLGKEVAPQTIHAGLECACFYKHLPGVEIVSFGPTMGDVHTAKEWVDTASVERFWEILNLIIVS
jgi:dipeptidase D